MEINENKSAIMFLNNINNKKRNKFPDDQIEKIPVVESYKYLGVIF